MMAVSDDFSIETLKVLLKKVYFSTTNLLAKYHLYIFIKPFWFQGGFFYFYKGKRI